MLCAGQLNPAITVTILAGNQLPFQRLSGKWGNLWPSFCGAAPKNGFPGLCARSRSGKTVVYAGSNGCKSMAADGCAQMLSLITVHEPSALSVRPVVRINIQNGTHRFRIIGFGNSCGNLRSSRISKVPAFHVSKPSPISPRHSETIAHECHRPSQSSACPIFNPYGRPWRSDQHRPHHSMWHQGVPCIFFCRMLPEYGADAIPCRFLGVLRLMIRTGRDGAAFFSRRTHKVPIKGTPGLSLASAARLLVSWKFALPAVEWSSDSSLSSKRGAKQADCWSTASPAGTIKNNGTRCLYGRQPTAQVFRLDNALGEITCNWR